MVLPLQIDTTKSTIWPHFTFWKQEMASKSGSNSSFVFSFWRFSSYYWWSCYYELTNVSRIDAFRLFYWRLLMQEVSKMPMDPIKSVKAAKWHIPHRTVNFVLLRASFLENCSEFDAFYWFNVFGKVPIKQGSIENLFMRRSPLPDCRSRLSGHLFAIRNIGLGGPF